MRYFFNCYIPTSHDEDAFPYSDNDAIIVCDGLGGTGASPCTRKSDGTERSEAFFASRIVSAGIIEFLSSNPQFLKQDMPIQTIAIEIKNAIERELSTKALAEKYDYKAGRFKTTLAVATFYEKKGTQELGINVFWAGDSRVFLLDADGLHQLSRDDSMEDFDAFVNKDCGMTNTISPSGFKINYAQYKVKSPCIVFACSDGCFDYVDSPLAVELYIIEALYFAKQNINDRVLFSQKMDEYIRRYNSGDDRTIAGCIFVKDELSLETLYSSLEQRHTMIRPDKEKLEQNSIAASDFSNANSRELTRLKSVLNKTKSDLRVSIEDELLKIGKNGTTPHGGMAEQWYEYLIAKLEAVGFVGTDYYEKQRKSIDQKKCELSKLKQQECLIRSQQTPKWDELRTALVPLEAYRRYYFDYFTVRKENGQRELNTNTNSSKVSFLENVRQRIGLTSKLEISIEDRIIDSNCSLIDILSKTEKSILEQQDALNKQLSNLRMLKSGRYERFEIVQSSSKSNIYYSQLSSEIKRMMELRREFIQQCISFGNLVSDELLQEVLSNGLDRYKEVFEVFCSELKPTLKQSIEALISDTRELYAQYNLLRKQIQIVEQELSSLEDSDTVFLNEIRNVIRSSRVGETILNEAIQCAKNNDHIGIRLFSENLKAYSDFAEAVYKQKSIFDQIAEFVSQRAQICDKYRASYDIYKRSVIGSA